MPAPLHPPKAALRALLIREYGLDGELVAYPGEEACNTAVRTTTGHFMLKLLPSCPHELTELQAAAFEHVALRTKGVAIPNLVRTVRGERTVRARFDDGDRSGLLTTFLAGRAFASTSPVRQALLRSLGAQLGTLDRALLDFAHPAAQRPLRWDLLQAAWIGDELDAIPEPRRRALVAAVHHRFVTQWQRELRAVRHSVIHGDANDQNLLVECDADGNALVTGIIDFGDMSRSALIGDIAIAATYASLRSEEPLAAIAEVIAGCHEVLPLDDCELELALPCVLVRLAVSVTMAACRRRDGTADDYALNNEEQAWALLERLSALDVRVGHAAIRSTCGLTARPATDALLASLRARSGTFAPVLGNALAAGRTTARVVDLSFGSVLAGDDPTTFDPAVCSARIQAELAEHGSALGVGRYGEPRTIYPGAAFAGPTPHHERRTMHLGVDLFAPAGSAVHAPLDGEVARVHVCTDRFDYGGMVVLRHTDADGSVFGTLYGHLDPASVNGLQVGGRIARSAAFASLGARPHNGDWPEHLHFQILAFDPAHGPEVPPGVATPSTFAAHAALYPDPSPLLGLGDEARWREPDTAAMRDRRARHFAPNLFVSYREPVALVRGSRHHMFDAHGRRFLDAYNNVPHVGHSHPHVVAAVCTQTKLLATNTRYLNELQLAYAERLTARLPSSLRVCYFVASGSEANEIALRLVRAHTRRREFLVMEHGYHGATTGAVDISPYKWGKGYVTQPDWAHASVQPDVYRGAHHGDDAGAMFARDVAVQIAALRARGRVLAGYLCECLPSVGGQIVMPRGFLHDVYASVRAAGGLCIADDVQTALGRTGEHFFGFEQQGVVPDVLVLGKPLGNGFPLAAVVTTEAIRDSFARGPEFFSTFGGSTVACAAGLAVLDVLEDEVQLPLAPEGFS